VSKALESKLLEHLGESSGIDSMFESRAAFRN